MKIYHGTSFENACKILSEKEWVYPIEFYLRECYDVYGFDNKAYKKPPIELGNHFSTNVNTAKSYALLHEKPVILFFDDIETTTACDDFIYLLPIPTSKVKAVLLADDKIGFYGGLVNALYGKQKIVITRKYGGMVYGDSRKGIKEMLKLLIKEL